MDRWREIQRPEVRNENAVSLSTILSRLKSSRLLGRFGAFRLTFAARLRNHLFACIAHIREMIFHAGFNSATARRNTCANLFDVRFTSLADRPRPYQRKLAGQRKVLEMRLDARPATLCRMSRAPSLYIGSACCTEALLREHHGRCSGNREKRYSRDSGEKKGGPCSHVEVPLGAICAVVRRQ